STIFQIRPHLPKPKRSADGMENEAAQRISTNGIHREHEHGNFPSLLTIRNPARDAAMPVGIQKQGQTRQSGRAGLLEVEDIYVPSTASQLPSRHASQSITSRCSLPSTCMHVNKEFNKNNTGQHNMDAVMKPKPGRCCSASTCYVS
ncbi:unnamed protein product, partial [Durusdinium trenchii]